MLVLLRGKLRHHSLKSPHRWDPNKQEEYENAARFLGAVVGDIVLKESLGDIYEPTTMQRFRQLAVSTGYESKITVKTRRLETRPAIALDMSYPTTLLSSSLCLAVATHALEECDRQGQLADTVKLEATDSRNDLELFTLELGVWAYTKDRVVESSGPLTAIRCSFEHEIEGLITRNEFSIPVSENRISILDVWRRLKVSIDHIQNKNPTTRIMALRLLLGSSNAILTYRVGVQVRH